MTTAIVNYIKELKTTVKTGNQEAAKSAFEKLKKHYPKHATKFEAELKAQEEAKAAAELKAQEEVIAKAKAEIQELTLAEVVKQNAVLTEKLEELSQLFHRFSDAAMKKDVKHEHIIAELHGRIHELQSHCSGGSSGFHDDVE